MPGGKGAGFELVARVLKRFSTFISQIKFDKMNIIRQPVGFRTKTVRKEGHPEIICFLYILKSACPRQ